MEPSELLIQLAEMLEQLNLPYFVTGSMATIIYGEPRFTNDIDVVVELQAEIANRFCRTFPSPEFYCSEDAVNNAIRSCRPFNIIHPASGLKIDVMVPESSAFNKSRFRRRQLVEIAEGRKVWFAAPEDVILKKLDYYRQGGSEKHVRDIAGVLKIQAGRIDMIYIKNWADRLHLRETWDAVYDEYQKKP